LAACDSGSDPPLSKVFKTAPWQNPETYSYELRDQGDKVTGTCDLKTTPNSQPGQTFLEHLCGNGKGDRDDRNATVDAQTLLPVTAKRTIFGIDQNSTATFTSTYTYPTVGLHADENGKTHDTTRDLPKASSDSPDPGYYDDESLFWVVRGVPLEKNWEGSYDDINASLGTVFSTTVKVESTETLKVPAGTYTAWRVRVETNDDTNYFWVDQASPHEIVQATISDVTYKLTATK
jgi:hypothetical protein